MALVIVDEATGPLLDCLVAIADGRDPFFASGYVQLKRWIPGKPFSPAVDWGEGGQFIDQMQKEMGSASFWYKWKSEFAEDEDAGLLIAAMRCFVISKLGEEVEFPDHLVLAIEAKT